MKRIKIYLVLLGALFWICPLVAKLTPTTGSRFSSPHPHPTLLTLGMSFGLGALAFWLAWGIHRRLLMAWRIGFVGLYGIGSLSIYELTKSIAFDERIQALGIKVALISLSVGMFLLVLLYLGRCWHAQRNYFPSHQ